jgi:pimeloyl-ACP methyl ester carboxylesterase
MVLLVLVLLQFLLFPGQNHNNQHNVVAAFTTALPSWKKNRNDRFMGLNTNKKHQSWLKPSTPSSSSCYSSCFVNVSPAPIICRSFCSSDHSYAGSCSSLLQRRGIIKKNNNKTSTFLNQIMTTAARQGRGNMHSVDFQEQGDRTTMMGPPVDLQYMCLKVEHHNENNNNNNNNSNSNNTHDNDETITLSSRRRAGGSGNSTTSRSSSRYPPVILLHGLLGQKRNLASLGAALYSQLKKKRDIYALDLRNHGDNTHDWRDEMSYSHMSLDVINFMDQNNIQNAVLIGHSMGGKLASSMALSHPERVQGLIVLDIAPVTYTDHDTAWKSVQDIVDTLEKVDVAKFDKKADLDSHLQKSVEDPSLRAFILTSIKSVKGDAGGPDGRVLLQWKINIDAIVQQMNVLAGFDVCYHGSSDKESSLQHLQYNGDAFFVNSPISRYIKHSHMDTIKRYFPNFMLTTIKGVGHSLHTDSPEATVELLKKYLDR